MTHDLLLFDLDGTLSDPLVGIEGSLNYALEAHGLSPLLPGQAAEFIGPPIDWSFQQITGFKDDARIAELVARYRERYAAVGYAENALYPGIREALDQLSAAGIAMAVCTSKREDFAEKILNRFGIRSHFRFVSGGNTGVHKWQQIEALRNRGLVSEASLMIGDRSIDLIAAHRNSLPAGGVLWGYGSLAELSAEEPRYLFHSPADWDQLIR